MRGSDIEVRAGSSHPDNLQLAGARPIAFDWDDRSTGTGHEDIDAVFVVRPDREDAPDLVSALVALTPSRTHVVLLSEVDNGYFSDGDWMMRVEEAVRDSGRTWTVLRPVWFMQVLTDPRFFRDDVVAHGRLRFVSDGRGVAWIDTRDIAAVAAAALTEPGHDARVYDLTGPEALTLGQTTKLLSSATGRPVEPIEASMDEALGDSEGFQRRNDYGAFDRVCVGVTEKVTDTVQRVTGNAPRTLEQFLADHAGDLRSAP